MKVVIDLSKIKSNLKKYWFSVVYELSILSINIGAGHYFFSVSVLKALSIFFVFLVSSLIIGGKMHFKPWYQCAFWSFHLLIGLFYIYTNDIFLAYLMCIIFAFLLSHKADIRISMFAWSPKGQSKYQREFDYIKNYRAIKDSVILDFEAWQEKDDPFLYRIYKYIFLERLSWEQTSKLVDVDCKRLEVPIDKIASNIRSYCKI